MYISVKNYTNRFVVIAILIVMAIWALLFYAVIMDEVYDNIDDGLKNQKILIIREVYKNPNLINESKEFGVNQFVIKPVVDFNDTIDENKFSKEFIYMPYDSEEEPYRVLKTGFYDDAGKPYYLEIRTSTVEEDDFLIDLAISLSVLYVVLVLSIIVINYYVLNKVWRPFDLILKNLGFYRFGNEHSFREVKTKVREFNDLNNHIKHMINLNETIFNKQKVFLENASHELQTPLAVSLNKLELLLENTDLSENDLIKIVEAKRSLHRMVSLNKSLLMLSRIENNQYSSKNNISIANLIRSLLEDYEDLLEFKNIDVQFESKNDFFIDANPELIRILVSNLLSNAIKYNSSLGKISIVIDENSLTISNASMSAALNPDYIFDRFYKGTQDNTSNGLGLSIVKTILEKYPFISLKYNYKDNMQNFKLMINKS